MHYALPTVKEPARGNVRVSGPLRLSPVKSVTLCTPGREPWLSQPTDQRLVLALPRPAGLKQAAFPSSSSLISETPGEPVLQRQLHSLSTYYTLSIFLIQVSLICLPGRGSVLVGSASAGCRSVSGFQPEDQSIWGTQWPILLLYKKYVFGD